MLDNIAAGQVASLGSVGGLSKSDTARLKDAYPNGPQFTGDSASTTTIDDTVVTMSRSGYREGYKTIVMDGPSASSAEFGTTIDMDYGKTEGTTADLKPPALGAPVPDGEQAPGSDGATIISSGIGPNVNVHGTLMAGEDGSDPTRKVVDPTPSGTPPFVGNGSVSPSASTSISDGDVHGGGVKGSSA